MVETNYIEVAKEKFKLNIKKIDSVPESYSSKVYKLTLADNSKVIIKVPYTLNKYYREIYALKYLRNKLPVPELIDTYEAKDFGIMLLDYVDGLPINDDIDTKLAYDLGSLLARLHTNKVSKFGDLAKEDSYYQSWWEFIKSTFISFIPYCERVISTKELIEFEKTFFKLFSQLPEADGPCFIHMDYRPGNILIKDREIVALIDFESVRGGSADIDLTKIKHYVWDKFDGTKEEFLAGYSQVRPVPDLSITLPFYTFTNAFNSIGWCIKRDKINYNFINDNLAYLRQINDIFGNNNMKECIYAK